MGPSRPSGGGGKGCLIMGVYAEHCCAGREGKMAALRSGRQTDRHKYSTARPQKSSKFKLPALQKPIKRIFISRP